MAFPGVSSGVREFPFGVREFWRFLAFSSVRAFGSSLLAFGSSGVFWRFPVFGRSGGVFGVSSGKKKTSKKSKKVVDIVLSADYKESKFNGRQTRAAFNALNKWNEV